MKVYFFRLFIGCFLVFSCTEKNPIYDLITQPIPEIEKVVKHLDQHGLQVIFTQIDRDDQGVPSFTDHRFGVDDRLYFYPASTVKLPVAVLTLQRINELKEKGFTISLTSPLIISAQGSTSFKHEPDTTALNDKWTLAQLIANIFLVSDNEAYNYLFDFLGADYINRELQKKGFKHSQILHKLGLNTGHRGPWKYQFYKEGEMIYHQLSAPSSTNQERGRLMGEVIGKAYLNDAGEKVHYPFDFGQKNQLSLNDMHAFMKRILFPESFAEEDRFNLNKADYVFLRRCMGATPLTANNPAYTQPDYWDSYVKFFMFGDQKTPIPKHIRIYNKVGEAYGTLTETAYITDSQQGIEFMLSATVFVNENGIFNDDLYEYEDIGIPFLAALGRAVYAYERSRINRVINKI